MAVDMEYVNLINGGLIKSHTGQMVHIWMKVEESSSGGHFIQGITTDKKTVTVKFESPLNQLVSGWVEVIGTSDGTGINCSEIIMFNHDENSEPLDEAAHNQMIMFMHNVRDFDVTGDDERMME